MYCVDFWIENGGKKYKMIRFFSLNFAKKTHFYLTFLWICGIIYILENGGQPAKVIPPHTFTRLPPLALIIPRNAAKVKR